MKSLQKKKNGRDVKHARKESNIQRGEKLSKKEHDGRRNMTNQEKHLVSIKKKEQRIQSGKISDHFPEISGITINAINYHGKRNPVIIKRVFKFVPDSYAYFVIECLRKRCENGGFDFGKIIRKIVKERKSSESGKLFCNGNNLSEDHSYILYKISIRYGK